MFFFLTNIYKYMSYDKISIFILSIKSKSFAFVSPFYVGTLLAETLVFLVFFLLLFFLFSVKRVFTWPITWPSLDLIDSSFLEETIKSLLGAPAALVAENQCFTNINTMKRLYCVDDHWLIPGFYI